jgi:hypothetical protein
VVQVQVLAAMQLEGVSGNNTTRNLRFIIYKCYFLCFQHTHIVLVCFYSQFFSSSNGDNVCGAVHPPGTKFHNYDHLTICLMIIIRHRQSDSYSSFFYHYQCIDVDLDKCTKAPTDAPTDAPTKAPTDAPTALATKASNCQFADGKPGTKCDGLYACVGIEPSNIGCGSCNGEQACRSPFTAYTDKVSVGENSCNGSHACINHISHFVYIGAGSVIGKKSW